MVAEARISRDKKAEKLYVNITPDMRE